MPLYGLARVPAPEPVYEEYHLPQSCSPSGYDTRFLVADDTWANEGRGAVILLDMDSGSYATVLAEPLNDGFTAITSDCSDRWVVWEEMRGNEQVEPWDVQWHLYAAPILADGQSIGAPELVASSVTSIHSRPLFQVAGETVYWMTNSAPNSRQEGALRGSMVEQYDLAAKRKRVVYRCDLNMHTAYVDAGELIVSVYTDAVESSQEVRIIDVADGTELSRRSLGNTDDVSHWPTYHDDYLVWGEMKKTLSMPALVIVQNGRERHRLRSSASDPVFVGGFMAFETESTIEVANLESKQLYTLYERESSNEPCFNLVPPQPWRESVLVAFGTRWGHPDDPQAATLVRRYRF